MPRYDVIETDFGFHVRDTLDGALIDATFDTVSGAQIAADELNAPAVDGPTQQAA